MKALALVLVFCAAGCGYLTHGSTQKVMIDTSPSKAPIQVDGVPHTSPAILELERVRHHTVTARSTSGAPLATHIESETMWRYQILDFFVLPIIANIIDGVTGGDSDLVPSKVVLPLNAPPPK